MNGIEDNKAVTKQPNHGAILSGVTTTVDVEDLPVPFRPVPDEKLVFY